MKLFHIGITAGEGKWISRAFTRNFEYMEIQPGDNQRINDAFDRFKPEIVFMQIQREGNIDKGLVNKMSGKAFVINWSGDVREPIPSWYFEISKICLTCFSNEKHSAEIGGEYLQIGIDPEIYRRWDPVGGSDIVFMANRSSCFPLSGYRDEVIKFLKQNYGSRFKLYGRGWPAADGTFMGDQVGESRFYNGSKIGISVSHFNIERYFSDRLIRIMASGCFALSHNYEGIEKDFKIGRHLDVFNDLAELRDKIEFYLKHDRIRKEIAQNGYELAHKNFTTQNMINDILKLYENKSFY